MSIRIDQKKITDFQTMHDAVQDTSMEIVQLEGGTMTGTLTHLLANSVGISAADFSRGFRGRGIQSESKWTVSSNAKPVVIRGFEVEPGDLFLLAPGQEIYASYTSANSYTVALFEPDVLFAFLESQKTGAADAAIWRRPASVLRADRKSAADRVEAFRALSGIINQHDATISADAAEREILERITTLVLDNIIDHDPRPPLHARKLVCEIDLHLSESDKRAVVKDLCERYGLPRRTLFNAFDDVLGVPPLVLQRCMRLCGVYAVLSQGSPDLLIKDVAIAHGFRDGSKFAGDYRDLFDENPRQTLQRAQRQRQNHS